MPGEFTKVLKTNEYIAITDLPNHYSKCEQCGGDDESVTLRKYGLCLKCAGKIYGDLPQRPTPILLAVARILMFTASERHVTGPQVEIFES